MLKNKIAIFGYGNHGKFIAKGLLEDGFDVTVIESEKHFFKDAKSDNFKQVFFADVTKDSELKKLELESFSQLVCVMDDEHLNVFLTLSLRSLFKDSYILSISDSLNVTKKLQMAGANKVIDLYEVSANKIYNILEKPIATKVLEDFVNNKSGITFREMLIPPNSFLDGMMVEDVNFSSYGVLLVGLIDEELSHSFVFVTAGIAHKLDSGDTIVCLGEKKELEVFEALIKKKER
ncbi:Potassium channel protein [hydrothermal vent metagenome]|uniref:Potassium channel protein n=1 Tax=hydrothermal vent metagenome TaxID=652676 RepID=A0A1W1BJQ3_9ZZZZ